MTEKEKLIRIEELKKQIVKVKTEHDYAKAMNLALKLVLNGTYGAICHTAFTVSNSDVANSITASSREVINYILDRIEDYFYNDWGKDKKAHELLGTVYIADYNNEKYIIRNDGKLIDTRGKSDDEESTGLNKILDAYAMNTGDIIENDKDVFIIDGNEYKVIHKLFVHDFSNIRGLPTGYSIAPDKTSKAFDKARGVREVPIIIYGDTDSLYISFTPLMEYSNYKGDELKFILHMNGVFIKHLFKEFLNEYAKDYNVKNLHDFELETINASGLHIQKKHYINNVVWEDGVFHENLSYFYPKGVDIVKSSTPVFVRENIWDFIKYLFSNPDNLSIREILKIVKNVKKQFMMANIEDISQTTSCSKYGEKVIDDQDTLEFVKGAHFGVKAAGLHNYLLNKNDKYKTKYDLIRGGKIKYYYSKSDYDSKSQRFGYLRSFHPNEITAADGVEVDYDVQFEKTFLSIANRFIEPIGLPKINKRISVLNGLFSFDKKKKDDEEKENKYVPDYENDYDDDILAEDEFDDDFWE